jgi:hypothetical protein
LPWMTRWTLSASSAAARAGLSDMGSSGGGGQSVVTDTGSVRVVLPSGLRAVRTTV